MSPSDTVAQLYPQALGSLFVTSYHSQGYGVGILTHLNTGNDYRTVNWESCRSCCGNVLAFGWRHWGKPQKPSVWIAGHLVEIWLQVRSATNRTALLGWRPQLHMLTSQEIPRTVQYLVSNRPVAGRQGRLQPVGRQRNQRIVLVIGALRASTVSRNCVWVCEHGNKCLNLTRNVHIRMTSVPNTTLWSSLVYHQTAWG
jgi:hypothetical protein